MRLKEVGRVNVKIPIARKNIVIVSKIKDFVHLNVDVLTVLIKILVQSLIITIKKQKE